MTNLTAPPPIGDRGAILLKHKRDLPKSTLLPVPAFDHDRLLPEVLRWWVLDNAGRTGAPIEYIAIAALCSLGSLLSPKVEFQPKRHDTGWTVRSNFWGLAVLTIQPSTFQQALNKPSRLPPRADRIRL
jgi:hypothetical protein